MLFDPCTLFSPLDLTLDIDDIYDELNKVYRGNLSKIIHTNQFPLFSNIYLEKAQIG